MGRVHRSFLPGTRIYACSNCRAHLTNHEDIVSKSFQGRTGRAYLFNTVVNITLGPIEDRILTTGLHKVGPANTISEYHTNKLHIILARDDGATSAVSAVGVRGVVES